MSKARRCKRAELRHLPSEAWPRWANWFLLSGLIVAGISADWYCAFEWFSERYLFWSTLVLQRMCMIVVSCAVIAFLYVLWRREDWKMGIIVFFAVSWSFVGYMLMGWIRR
jgi:hypothetical protein